MKKQILLALLPLVLAGCGSSIGKNGDITSSEEATTTTSVTSLTTAAMRSVLAFERKVHDESRVAAMISPNKNLILKKWIIFPISNLMNMTSKSLFLQRL